MNLGLTFGLVGLLFSSISIYLTPGGENIAFEIKTDGVIITGTYDIRIHNRKYNPSKDADIQKGDIILGVNNKKINSLAVPPAGIIGRTFSSRSIRQSIQTGPSAFIASAIAASSSAGVSQRNPLAPKASATLT